ncbi:hypothetical protein GGI43DRAFT_414940 [Trichoderma evansii]
MALIPYKLITSSPPFTFVVGHDQKEHTIHSALIAHQSEALKALVNEQTKEGTEGRVIWEHIHEDTFSRFSQYLYTGYYLEAEPKRRKGDAATPKKFETNRFIPSLGSNGFEGLVAPKKQLLWNKFLGMHPLPPENASAMWSPPGIIIMPDGDYTEVFLCHARMYVLANHYGIKALQILALANLRQILTLINPSAKGCGDINRLVRYCFGTADKGCQVDELKSLVCLYTACKVEILWRNAEFRDITRTLPEFSSMLIGEMLARLDRSFLNTYNGNMRALLLGVVEINNSL